uniref:Uncharacterized protein n=1 Tax=Strix occidentalis caurina TaxID=311401 RepID=A0A8D0G3S0_STROC
MNRDTGDTAPHRWVSGGHGTLWPRFRGTWGTCHLIDRVLASWGTCHLMAKVLGDMGDSPAGAGARGGSGRWSPLSGARLEEMVREATRLAAQLERCHLPPPAPPGPPPAPRSPRSPRRETFVVKDSPVRALLPTVESRGTPPHAATTTTRPPAKPRGAPTATNVPSTRKVGGTSRCRVVVVGGVPVLPV